MKIITVVPYPPLRCRAKGANCKNAAKHIVTIQPNPPVLTYRSIHLCDGHLAKLREVAGGQG